LAGVAEYSFRLNIRPTQLSLDHYDALSCPITTHNQFHTRDVLFLVLLSAAVFGIIIPAADRGVHPAFHLTFRYTFSVSGKWLREVEKEKRFLKSLMLISAVNPCSHRHRRSPMMDGGGRKGEWKNEGNDERTDFRRHIFFSTPTGKFH
jgi:hypothetical protein